MSTSTAAARRENLALLYQGLFTGIVRIQQGRQPISNADMFRRRMKEALAEVAREAIKRNYAAEHTVETDFAVIAFLDEVILNSNDSCRNDWAQKPLQEELFGIRVAGELFFTRVEKLVSRAESAEVADMLEVYYLCMLLGFEGRYAVGGKAELHMLQDRVRQRIDHIRGAQNQLSPNGFLPQEVVVAPPADKIAQQLKFTAIGLASTAVFFLILFEVHLLWKAAQVRDVLARSLLS
jgi:type VI secretion system protein ImpK